MTPKEINNFEKEILEVCSKYDVTIESQKMWYKLNQKQMTFQLPKSLLEK